MEVHNAPGESEYLNDFLINSIDNNQNEFVISGENSNNINWSSYFFTLREAVSRTINKCSIYNFNITGYEFCTIVKSSKNVAFLDFQRCKILTDDEWDFDEMDKYSISSMFLFLCGNSEYSNWDDNPERFLNILSGIKNCLSLYSSLTQIFLYYNSKKKDNLEMLALKGNDMLNNSIKLDVKDYPI